MANERPQIYLGISKCFLYPDEVLLRSLGEDYSLDELRIEYTRLFINSYPKMIAPPYGSVYIDGRLMGPSTMQVLAEYEKAGLGLNAQFKELPDHICSELEFMAYLWTQGKKQEEEEFRRSYFLSWAPTFFERVIKNTKLQFYKDMTITARDFFMEDK
ncbi:MAG: molecular chaperone TorD family protein [bacterium]